MCLKMASGNGQIHMKALSTLLVPVKANTCIYSASKQSTDFLFSPSSIGASFPVKVGMKEKLPAVAVFVVF